MLDFVRQKTRKPFVYVVLCAMVAIAMTMTGCSKAKSDEAAQKVKEAKEALEAALKESGVVWGYDLQYLMTGLFNQHPRIAISFTKDKRKDYTTFYTETMTMD